MEPGAVQVGWTVASMSVGAEMCPRMKPLCSFEPDAGVLVFQRLHTVAGSFERLRALTNRLVIAPHRWPATSCKGNENTEKHPPAHGKTPK